MTNLSLNLLKHFFLAQLDDNFDERELDFPDVTLKKCTEHPNQIVNLSCEDCRKMCCSYCILEYHQGHKSLWLYKLVCCYLISCYFL